MENVQQRAKSKVEHIATNVLLERYCNQHKTLGDAACELGFPPKYAATFSRILRGERVSPERDQEIRRALGIMRRYPNLHYAPDRAIVRAYRNRPTMTIDDSITPERIVEILAELQPQKKRPNPAAPSAAA